MIAVDFGGPYPDAQYNLAAIDKITRSSTNQLDIISSDKRKAEDHVCHPWDSTRTGK